MKNNLFKAEYDGVISITDLSNPAYKSADQSEGSLYIDMNKVVYFRDLNENSGLVHLMGGIDIELTKETFNRFVDQKSEHRSHWGY